MKAVYIPKGWVVVCVVGGGSPGIFEGRVGIVLVVGGREEREPLGQVRFRPLFGVWGRHTCCASGRFAGRGQGEEEGGEGEEEGGTAKCIFE